MARSPEREAMREAVVRAIHRATAAAGSRAAVARQLGVKPRTLSQITGGKNIGENLLGPLSRIAAGVPAGPVERRQRRTGEPAATRQPSGRRPAGKWVPFAQGGGRQFRSSSERRQLSALRGARNRGETVYLDGRGQQIIKQYPDRRQDDFGTGALSGDDLDDLIDRMEAQGNAAGLESYLLDTGQYRSIGAIDTDGLVIRSYAE